MGKWGHRARPFLPPLLFGFLLLFVASFVADRLGFGGPAYAGALAATLVGVIAGIPIALAVDRIQQRSEQRRTAHERAERRRTVLGLVHDELREDLRRLEDPAGLGKRPRPDLTYVPLLTSTWDALRSGGDLQVVDDPDLLGQISEAYEALLNLNRLDALAIQVAFGPMIHLDPTARTRLDQIRMSATKLQDEYLRVIRRAVEMASAGFDAAVEELARMDD